MLLQWRYLCRAQPPVTQLFTLDSPLLLILWLIRPSPSRRVQSMSWFSGLVSAGYLLNRLATKARFSLGLPLTTSAGVTNCRQPSRSACCSIYSALRKSSFSCQGCNGQELSWKRLGYKADGKLLTTTWSNVTSPHLASVANWANGWGTHTNPCCCAIVMACLAIFLSMVLFKLTCCQIFMLLELGGSKEVNMLPNGASPQRIAQWPLLIGG